MNEITNYAEFKLFYQSPDDISQCNFFVNLMLIKITLSKIVGAKAPNINWKQYHLAHKHVVYVSVWP